MMPIIERKNLISYVFDTVNKIVQVYEGLEVPGGKKMLYHIMDGAKRIPISRKMAKRIKKRNKRIANAAKN